MRIVEQNKNTKTLLSADGLTVGEVYRLHEAKEYSVYDGGLYLYIACAGVGNGMVNVANGRIRWADASKVWEPVKCHLVVEE